MPKQPKFKHPPTAEKKPAAVAPDFYQQYPSWRISVLEMVDPFGWHQVSREKVLDIRQKLANFESMTWGEILIKGKQNHHPVPVDQIVRPAQDRLREIGQDDVDDLISLRLAGRERVWGILEGSVLKVLWYDPQHQVYPVEKRFT